MSSDQIVIVGAKRTPAGAFQGVFKNVSATELGAAAIKGALEDTNLKPENVTEVIMGCVLPAGLRQAPARQAALKAGLLQSTHCSTINKVCGSGMKAVMLGHDQLLLGNSDVVIAGGMESMSNAPYLLPKARAGYRFGHGQVLDHMAYDGLEDAFDAGRSMGTYAEDTADRYEFTREQQDAFAIESGKRALKAIENKCFVDEIVPVKVKERKGEIEISEDEPPTKVNFEKIPALRPAFREGGTVTAANSSSLTDGAAALVLMRRSEAEMRGLKPLAVIHGHASHSHEPEWFTTAPVGAIKSLCEKLSWPLDSVDQFEINEAFAVVTMAAMKDLNLFHDKVNVHGGACALGHPIGASGARVIVTLINTLRRHKQKRGIAALCIGGGEAVATGIEVV